MTGLDGKIAIVTGGGSGLGEAIGKELAKRGAHVVLSDINLKGAERVAGEINELGGTASAVQQDTARPEDSERVVSHAVATFGALHYAVNNAGIGRTGTHWRDGPLRLGTRYQHQSQRRAVRHALSNPGHAEDWATRLRHRQHGVNPRGGRRHR